MDEDDFLIVDDYELEGFRHDFQRCIINNDTHFQSHYKAMLFEKETKDFLRMFDGFESLEIRPSIVNKSYMQFTGAIAEDIIPNISDEDMNKIKKSVFMADSVNLVMQMAESRKSEQQKNNERILAEMEFQEYIGELKEVEQEYREAKLSEKNLMKFIQKLLFEKCGLGLIYEKHKEMLTLSGNFTNIILDKEALNYLEACASKVDTFLIASIYDDSDDCTGVRLVLSIDLDKEE